MVKVWDVAVVGAGPAGSTIAKKIAEAGFEVIVLDRRNEVGVPVRCGEGIGKNVEKLTGLKVDSSWSNIIHKSCIISPDGSKLYLNGKGYTIERKMFDKLLALKAIDAGATLRMRTTVIGVKKGELITDHLGKQEKISAKLIIAADGVESYIGRKIGLVKNLHPHELDSCFQYEMKGIKLESSDCLELYFGSFAPRGYVWVFPKGEDRANVGVGVAGDSPNNAKYYLDAFINKREDLKNASITRVTAGDISVSKPAEKLVADGFMLVGSSAHMVGPLNGGGIEDAITAATIAGPVAVNALKSDDVSAKKLVKYQAEWWGKWGKLQVMQYKIRHILEQFNDEDFNYFIKSITQETIDKLYTLEGLSTAAKILMKRPKFGAIISGLLS